jgi:hypothetical protein
MLMNKLPCLGLDYHILKKLALLISSNLSQKRNFADFIESVIGVCYLLR